MQFDFDPQKSELLFLKRGVTFSDVIEAIAEHGVLADFPHPNREKYPHQRIMIVALGGYSYCIPYMQNGEVLFLKTIYPSRKFKGLLGDEYGQV